MGNQGKKVTILYSGEMVEMMAVTTVVSAIDRMAMWEVVWGMNVKEISDSGVLALAKRCRGASCPPLA